MFNSVIIILSITVLSLSVNKSYCSLILGNLIKSLNNLPAEHPAILQIFMALSIEIPVLPFSICDKNCALIFSFSANSSCVRLRLFLIFLTLRPIIILLSKFALCSPHQIVY